MSALMLKTGELALGQSPACHAVRVLPSLLRRLDLADQRAQGPVLGLCRIGVGSLWLANLHWKVPPSFGQSSGGGLFKYSESVSRHSPFGPFTWITEQIVLPNFQFFGWVTLISETVIAMLLLVGYRTKLAALAGAMLSVPIMLSVIYYDRADEWSWSYLLMIIANLGVYASDGGAHLGLDGVRRGPAQAATSAIRAAGIVTVAIGVLGLFVSRSVAFAGSRVALLGSDAGFVNDNGDLVRRWELKFLWFNPLWALLTLALGLLVLLGTRLRWGSRAGGAGLAMLAVVIMAMRTFDYVRNDGAVQAVATASNAAVWGALALAVLLPDAALRRGSSASADAR